MSRSTGFHCGSLVFCGILAVAGSPFCPPVLAAEPASQPAGASLPASGTPAAPGAATAPATFPSSAVGNDRYGFLDLLDHRSRYGQNFFPEPFRMDETDVDNELRGDYLYTTGKGQRVNLFHGEVEKSFGLLTIEVEAQYERDSDRENDPAQGDPYNRISGVDDIDLGGRLPVYQYVSADDFLDNSVGVAFEVGIPSGYAVLGRNTEIVPKVFDALRLGDHFSFQTILGWSTLEGQAPDGGAQHFEYGVLLGYNIDHEQLPLPGVDSVVPIFEIVGEHGINMDDAGKDVLSATVGPRVLFKPVNGWQPKLGLGLVIPLDKGAREEFTWGVLTSVVFEY